MIHNERGRLRSELEDEFRSIAGWWLTHVVDLQAGAIAGEVSDDNRPDPSAEMGLVYIARLLWFFSAAHRHAPHPDYRAAAELCRSYLLERFTDPENGGLVWSLDAEGRQETLKKQCYGQAFAVYGLCEFYLAFKDEGALEEASGLVDLLERHAHDREHGGYLEALSADWKAMDDVRLSEIDTNADKTMNTHLHILEAYTNYHRAMNSAQSAGLLSGLISTFIDRFVLPHGDHLACFYTREWEYIPAAVSFGHDIETSWLLCEAAAVLGDAKQIQRVRSCALNLAYAVLERGVDPRGGILHESGLDGHIDSSHVWWVQAEAMVGFFNAWQLTKTETFLDASLSCWSFIREQQIDHDRGEWLWFSSLDGQAKPVYKAGFWKGPYHNGRAVLEMMRRLADVQETIF